MDIKLMVLIGSFVGFSLTVPAIGEMLSIADLKDPLPIETLASRIPDVKWEENSRQQGDFNCDRENDTAFLGRTKSEVFVAVVLGPFPSLNESEISRIKLKSSGHYQDSVGKGDLHLSLESLDYDTLDSLGKNPPGFKKSSTCPGLILTSGETDSFHLYWNHDHDNLAWWRL